MSKRFEDVQAYKQINETEHSPETEQNVHSPFIFSHGTKETQ